MNRALILFLTFCFIGTASLSQSIFDTKNKLSILPILDGDYGGLLIPNAGIGIGYSRILNRKIEVELTLGYKVGLLNDNESLALEKVVKAEFDRVSFKRVTEVGINMKSYLFNAFGSMAPIGAYTQIGLQRSVIDLTHYDLISEDNSNTYLESPRFAKVRTIDLTLGIGKSSPWRNNIVVGAYGGIAFPIAVKFLEFPDEDVVSIHNSQNAQSYYRSSFGGEKGYFFANNGFQVRFSIAKAF